jgi:hypothetical protein
MDRKLDIHTLSTKPLRKKLGLMLYGIQSRNKFERRRTRNCSFNLAGSRQDSVEVFHELPVLIKKKGSFFES